MAQTLKIGIGLNVKNNRRRYLMALRSGKYKKGVATSDKNGKPIVSVEGYCACAVMIHELSPQRLNFKQAREALRITAKDCTYIQTKINDTDLSFPQIADRIESEIFTKSPHRH